MMRGLGTEFRDDASGKREHCDARHLASILGLTFETPNALISGHLAFVPKLTLFETLDEDAEPQPDRRE